MIPVRCAQPVAGRREVPKKITDNKAWLWPWSQRSPPFVIDECFIGLPEVDFSVGRNVTIERRDCPRRGFLGLLC